MAIILPPNSTGTTVDTNTVGGKDREIVNIGDPTTGAAVAAVLNTSPVGTNYGLVDRNIPIKNGSVLTTTALGISGVFTQAWQDGNADGTIYVESAVRADVASAASGFVIQETDDTTDANFTRTVASVSVSAATTTFLYAAIRGRSWRVQYTNGGAGQTTFKLTAAASPAPNPAYDSSGNLQVGVAAALPAGANSIGTVVLGTGAATIGALSANQSVNVAQYGSAATTLGQKVTASSVPIVPASDWATVDATFKALRIAGYPPEVLGCYQVNARTPTYTALAAGAPLFSMRWGDATRVAVVLRVYINVVTTVTATTAGLTERELVIARSFTVSDSGGTAITLTGNNQKLRTSFGTSLVTDMRVGGALTAGTRTLDAQPVSSVMGFSALTSTGVVIGGVSGGNVGMTGGLGQVKLLDVLRDGDYPIILAQNEGVIIRIGKDAQPAGATQQTYINILWCEANAF